MWAFEHAGIVPDVVLAAKAIANGLPLAALVSSRDLQARWGVGAHGSTYGGNPVACAAGIAVLEVIREEGLVANAAARGAELTRGLQALAAEDPRIGDVRGPGLMIGVEMVRDRDDARAGRRPGRRSHERRAPSAGCCCSPAGPTTTSCAGSRRSTSSRAEIEEALGIFQEVLLATR